MVSVKTHSRKTTVNSVRQLGDFWSVATLFITETLKANWSEKTSSPYSPQLLQKAQLWHHEDIFLSVTNNLNPLFILSELDAFIRIQLENSRRAASENYIMYLCEPVGDLWFSPWLVDCFFPNQGKQLSVSTTPGVLFIVLNVSPCSLTHNENHLIPVWNALQIYNRASFIIPVWSDVYYVVPVAKLNSNVRAYWTYKVHFDISSSRISTAG